MSTQKHQKQPNTVSKYSSNNGNREEQWVNANIERIEQQAYSEWKSLPLSSYTLKTKAKVQRFIKRYAGKTVTKGNVSRLVLVPEVDKANGWLQEFELNQRMLAEQKHKIIAINELIKNKECQVASTLLGQETLPNTDGLQFKIALCHAESPTSSQRRWRAAWERSQGLTVTKSQSRKLQQQLVSFKLKVVDDRETPLDNATVTAFYLDEDESNENAKIAVGTTKDGIVTLEGIPKGDVAVLVQSFAIKEEKQVVQATKSRRAKTIQVEKLPLTTLQLNKPLPAGAKLTLHLSSANQLEGGLVGAQTASSPANKVAKVEMYPRVPYTLLTDKYVISASLLPIHSPTVIAPVSLEPGHLDVSVWGYRIIDQDGKLLTDGLSLTQAPLAIDVLFKSNTILPKESRLTGKISPSPFGTVKEIQIETSALKPVTLSAKIKDVKKASLRNRIGFWFSNIGLTALASVGTYGQVTSNMQAEEARGVNSTQQQYDDLVTSSQQYQYIAYASYGLAAAVAGMSLYSQLKYGKLKKQRTALQREYHPYIAQEKTFAVPTSTKNEDVLLLRIIDDS